MPARNSPISDGFIFRRTHAGMGMTHEHRAARHVPQHEGSTARQQRAVDFLPRLCRRWVQSEAMDDFFWRLRKIY
jgi:hypothetical protein